MPKAKPVGLSVDTYTYTPEEDGIYNFAPYTCYRLLLDGKPIFESSTPQTRDYVLERMREREAERSEKLVVISA